MRCSHISPPKPSPWLALVALGIVFRFRPAWLAVDLKDAAHQEHVAAERISRLVTAALAGFEGVLAALTRRGRPPRRRDDEHERAELSLTRELLAVTTSLLARVGLRRCDVRELVVGAWLRLSSSTAIPQRRFCDALALPERTLRPRRPRRGRRARRLYGLPGPERSFVNTFAKYPIVVLRDAERSFQSQVHREDIRDRKSYFGAIVRRTHEEHWQWRRREAHHRDEETRLAREGAKSDVQYAAWAADPVGWLRHALAMLACQWDERARALLFEGHGLGLGWVAAALRRLCQVHGPCVARDMLAATVRAFRLAYLDRLGSDGVSAIVALVEHRWDALATRVPTRDLAAPTAPAILPPTGQKPRPPPSVRLSN